MRGRLRKSLEVSSIALLWASACFIIGASASRERRLSFVSRASVEFLSHFARGSSASQSLAFFKLNFFQTKYLYDILL